MNLQEKMLETTAELRTCALAVLTDARTRATRRVATLKGSFETLSIAGQALRKVARRHTTRFVKENSAIAREAGRDVSVLARTTYATLANRPVAAPAAKTRKARATRKRAATKAA